MSDRFLSSPIIKVKEISLISSLDSSYLLKNISFQLYRGDRLVIIGPSGAGKTTLLRLLNRLIEPGSGSIEIENFPLTKIPVIQLRRQIVLIPQEPKLLGMTVKEALAYPLILQQIPKREIQQRLEYWLNRLHVSEDWLDRKELQLSLGQRQLVSIARALIMEPKILLLDEPTSALDAGRANYLIEILIDLANSKQISIIMVNHQLDLAQKFASRILYLENGESNDKYSATEVDWFELKQNLVKAEAKAAKDWL
jgi:D-methionine transport system ATP-binding protein